MATRARKHVLRVSKQVDTQWAVLSHKMARDSKIKKQRDCTSYEAKMKAWSAVL